MNPFEFPENIERYISDHTSDEDQILQDLFRTTHLKTVHPQMLSGKVQGQFLSFISQMIKPERILEIGTFTGYSAYCLAKGLSSEGKLTCIEVNEELEDLISDFFNKAGIAANTNLIIGDALEVIPALEDSFDIIFLDANKEHYPTYLEMCVAKLSVGGYLIADNVLWGGKVAEKELHDQSSIQLHRFNELVQSDPRLDNVFLSIRDGLMIARKL